jgi:hypothetical protein
MSSNRWYSSQLFLIHLQSIGIAELKAQLAEQDRTIKMLVQQRAHGSNEVEMGERTGLLQDKTKSSTGTLSFNNSIERTISG